MKIQESFTNMQYGPFDPGEFHRPRSPFGLPYVEAEDPFDVGMGGEDGQEMAADEACGTGDRNRMHPHTLTAWPIRLNLETPKSPRNRRFPAFRFSSGAPAAAISIPPISTSRRSTSAR